MANIPKLGDLPRAPKRIILHWTGGPSTANSVDRKAYHYVVEHTGKVVDGVFPVAANMRPLNDENYAHHTGGFNSFSVGVSFAGMAGWESTSKPGNVPLREGQVLAGLRFVAECCDAWNLDPLNDDHVFHHREAWELHGVKGTQNHVKNDITHLPFHPELGPKETGPWLRKTIAAFLNSPDPIIPLPIPTPGERRWSRTVGWIRLERYVNDSEWFFRPESDSSVPPMRAGARWSQMALQPLK